MDFDQKIFPQYECSCYNETIALLKILFLPHKQRYIAEGKILISVVYLVAFLTLINCEAAVSINRHVLFEDAVD